MSVPWTRGERWAVVALGAVTGVTAAWWALALWPVPSDGAAWLERARQVCFGTSETGLPDSGGWLLLVGQPLTMVAALFVIWGEALKGGLWALTRTFPGKATLALGVMLVLAGALGATVRVAQAVPDPPRLSDSPLPPSTYPRLDRPAPPLGLVDQHGQRVSLDELRGRTVFVTFAFGHCETICPLVVHSALEAAEAVAELDPVVLVVTLDPWRDTPSRLGYLASQWNLGANAFVLGGTVDEVEAALDRWNVARERDPRTGDIAHPPLLYIVGRDGRIAYATNGDPAMVASLALRTEAR